MARHIHANKMIQAANDTSIEWQSRRLKMIPEQDWECCVPASGGVVIFVEGFEYRKKPREFQEGHWYQVAFERPDDYTQELVIPFIGGAFIRDNERYDQEQISWIGESLGKLKFGD